MKAVLWDMDGTLVDSEKLWDVSLAALYDKLGGELTPAVRASMVGSVAENTMRIIYADLGLDLDPASMADSSRWLNDYTAKLFDDGLPWCDGARELLEGLAAEGTPMALVTNTQRALTDRALNSIGRQYFSATVCGDEVPPVNLRPTRTCAPPRYWSWCPRNAWPSRTPSPEPRQPSAPDARCWWCPTMSRCPIGRRRRHISSLAGLSVADLRAVHSRTDYAVRRTHRLTAPCD